MTLIVKFSLHLHMHITHILTYRLLLTIRPQIQNILPLVHNYRRLPLFLFHRILLSSITLRYDRTILSNINLWCLWILYVGSIKQGGDVIINNEILIGFVISVLWWDRILFGCDYVRHWVVVEYLCSLCEWYIVATELRLMKVLWLHR